MGPLASGWSVQLLHIIWFRSQTLLVPPPPSVADVSEALLVAIKGKPARKCDLCHAGSHAGEKSVKPTADRPPGMDRECTGQQCGGTVDDNAALRLLGDAGRYDVAARFTASIC